MTQQAGAPNRSLKTTSTGAARSKQYAAGGPYDLVADGNGDQCCKAVAFMATGNLTHCLMADGVTDRPITGAPAGYVHNAQCSSITPSVAVVVYW